MGSPTRYPFPFRDVLRCVGYRGERKNSHGHPSKRALPPAERTLGVRGSQRQILCRSYTRSLARCSNIPSNWLTPIVTAPATVRSAIPNIHSPRMASTRARSSTLISMASSACAVLMPSLPAHRLPAARVRFAVPAQQPDGDRAVSRHATPPGANTEPRRRNRAVPDALPARPVLDSPLSRASRGVVRRSGRVDPADSRARLRPPRPGHARIHRLDCRSPLPVWRRALPPAGLAPQSGSRRPPCRILLRRGARLSFPTHHLHGTAKPSAVSCRPGEKNNSMDDKAEKVALFRYGLIAPLVLETLPRGELTSRAQQIAARLYDIPHSARRQVSVDTLLDWSLRYRRNGLTALSPQPRQDRG